MALISDPTPEDPEEQYKLVYAGIISVAIRCDGAITEDGVGFNGIDTHFGRRIASVPFEEWTPEIKEEAARIVSTYRTQVETYIGINLNQLPVVREANGWDQVDFSGVEKRGGQTNYAARDQARGIERRQAGSKLVSERKATKLEDGTLALTWNSKDPDCFGALLAGVKALPGRVWTGSRNVVDFTPEAVDFIEEFALAADFDLTVARADAAAAVQAEAERPKVTLYGKDQVKIESDGYVEARVFDARKLPGRQYKGSGIDICDLTPAVLTFAKKWGLVVDPAVEAKLNGLQAAKLDDQTKETMLLFVSRQADPSNLPPAFEALVQAGRVR